jgi:SAM-dependent methyltransferase
MRKELLNYLICPTCSLSFERIGSELKCRQCGANYPIVNDIPRIVPRNGNYTDSFGYQWNLYARTQLDSYSGLPISEDRLYQASSWPKNLNGELILEAGCGAGRFTEVLVKNGATIISLDYSNAVEANLKNNGAHQNLHIFQGDILNLPLRKNSFDRVICLGVLQHTADPDSAFKSLAAMVKPGGHLVIDIYAARWTAIIGWQYLLRPFTSRLPKKILYNMLRIIVPILFPIAYLLSNTLGRVGRKLMPIPEYSFLGLSYRINQTWSLLDSFDIYAPRYDQPRSKKNVEKWYADHNFSKVVVFDGYNGVVARGQKNG